MLPEVHFQELAPPVLRVVLVTILRYGGMGEDTSCLRFMYLLMRSKELSFNCTLDKLLVLAFS